jgi:hypothetical protein
MTGAVGQYAGDAVAGSDLYERRFIALALRDG